MCGGTTVDENMGAVLSASNHYLFPAQHGTLMDLIRYFFGDQDGEASDAELPQKRYVLKSIPKQEDIICDACLEELVNRYKHERDASGKASFMLVPKDGS